MYGLLGDGEEGKNTGFWWDEFKDYPDNIFATVRFVSARISAKGFGERERAANLRNKKNPASKATTSMVGPANLKTVLTGVNSITMSSMICPGMLCMKYAVV